MLLIGALARPVTNRGRPPTMLAMGPIAARFEAALPAVRELLRSRGAVLGYLFGSVAEGRERLDSDLDVAVLLGPEIPRDGDFDRLLDLNTALVGLTHTNHVDVVMLNTAPPLLAFEIVSKGRLILGDDPERVEFEVAVLKRLYDTAPLRKVQHAAFAARLGVLDAELAKNGELAKSRTPW